MEKNIEKIVRQIVQERFGPKAVSQPAITVTMGSAGKVFLKDPAVWSALPSSNPISIEETPKPGAYSRAHPIAALMDHTILRPAAVPQEIEKVCKEAKRFGFAAVCVSPIYVSLAAKVLRGSAVKVCAVIGFPFGTATTLTKVFESRDAIANGAEELDMVLNVGSLKSGNDAQVLQEIQAVRQSTEGKVLKVILETALLNREEKIRACQMAKTAGANFVKTSTGFAESGATLEDVRLMRETVGSQMGVKASGGIKTLREAVEFVKAGATRIGTSASVMIVTENPNISDKGGI